jgi:subtilisin family serine protease
MASNGGRDPSTASRALATSDLFSIHVASDPAFVVGVIDTGIVLEDDRYHRQPHPFLQGHLTPDWDHNEDHLPKAHSRLRELDGHGTFVAGVILREAPTVTIHMRNVLDESAGAGDDETVAAAIRGMRDVPNLKVVNLSFFGASKEQSDDVAQIKSALDDLLDYNQDIVVVAAAGNWWTGDEAWPAAFDKVIAVGAVDETVFPLGNEVPPKASFSNYGHWVDAYASGVQVLGPYCWYRETAAPDGESPRDFTGWARMSGTSFAAAIVTGVIAQRMIDKGIPGRETREQVLGQPGLPKVRTPGIPEEQWSPYIRGIASTWPASGREL